MISINIAVSHNQIVIRSIPHDLQMEQWNDTSVEFGMVWHKNYLSLDPLVEGGFGAYFLIESSSEIKEDNNAQRSALIPFEVTDADQLCISTVPEAVYLFRDDSIDIEHERKCGNHYPLNSGADLNIEPGKYNIHFQVCVGIPPGVGIDDEEVYYRFNFIKTANPEFKALIADDYGWDTSTQLPILNT
ncbi:hypothetical protein D0C36_12670 [Mucilaginibacter conchicola]|uniref:Competence protein J (ComJ) n=1 Tax=Mucilaginibacter conchicola TaxID=2303333 RepID=A0A372NSR1_9SPHI|nr:competence protein ComJ [Mucilaginibacter conchicola]RFZ92285.1 hypothetical protein D0C36_12670 [Mucilaginibacter conchicola]